MYWGGWSGRLVSRRKQQMLGPALCAARAARLIRAPEVHPPPPTPPRGSPPHLDVCLVLEVRLEGVAEVDANVLGGGVRGACGASACRCRAWPPLQGIAASPRFQARRGSGGRREHAPGCSARGGPPLNSPQAPPPPTLRMALPLASVAMLPSVANRSWGGWEGGRVCLRHGRGAWGWEV